MNGMKAQAATCCERLLLPHTTQVQFSLCWGQKRLGNDGKDFQNIGTDCTPSFPILHSWDTGFSIVLPTRLPSEARSSLHSPSPILKHLLGGLAGA